MTKQPIKYTLNNIQDIIFEGFDFSLPEETLKIISELSLQVGSPDYVKTPIFQKRDNPMKVEPTKDTNIGFKKINNRRNKSLEILSSEDWDTIRTFQTTKIEEKVGLDLQIDSIRALLNKITDKNYLDNRKKIFDIIDKLITENIQLEDMSRLSSTIFEIASNNRFYSKIYADLYSDLISS